jgi:hypothetical protein
MLGEQEHDGAINFATDAWTSPNSRAFVAVTAHFEHQGVPISILLDIVQVAHSHSGINLAAAFAKILEDFGISDKASTQVFKLMVGTQRFYAELIHYVR